jgi:hypothetical protein
VECGRLLFVGEGEKLNRLNNGMLDDNENETENKSVNGWHSVKL